MCVCVAFGTVLYVCICKKKVCIHMSHKACSTQYKKKLQIQQKYENEVLHKKNTMRKYCPTIEHYKRTRSSPIHDHNNEKLK